MEAPQINCPKDIEAKTQEQQDSANISWPIPTAKDNSGERVRFTQIFASFFEWILNTLQMCVIVKIYYYVNDSILPMYILDS